ncbi:MAG: hypothetical protein H0V86_00340 [Chloroflexia bacterium]|nr:hypothetical protein [Chloroflexia bacterium]
MTSDIPLYAGIDGGGTKTLAVVVDAAGHERGRHAAGSGNFAAVGVARAAENVRAAIEGAMAAAGNGTQPAAAWIGLAGVDRPEDVDLLLPQLSPLAGVVRISNDAELALTALDNALGVAVIAGTGSIALGRDASGRLVRAGGWGHVIGDEGSGWEMGRLALQAVARATDGRGPGTSLVRAVIKHWNLRNTDGIYGILYPDTDKALVAGLTSVVLAEAGAGDVVAKDILDHAAEEIALLTLTVGEQLTFPNAGMPLALAGGILVNESGFRAMVLERVRQRRAPGQVAVVQDAPLSAARAAHDLLLGDV